MTPPPVPVPRYGAGALPDLPESVLAAFGVADAANVLGLPARRRVCVLIIDGLGWDLLHGHLELAPFLASLARRELTAGFPATTATSLASLGTGLGPAGHGLLGYQVLVPGTGRLLNHLRWSDQVDPLVWQPHPTAYERAAAAGVGVAYVASRQYAKSGLSVATTRGARYTPADGLGQLVAQTETALRAGDRAYVTVYHPDLDSTGHAFGAGSPAWRHQLRFVDALAERVAEVLPPDAVMYVTADHGMTNPGERVDAESVAALREGVALLGGEPRARHVYAAPGAAADVLAAWRETLGDRAWVLPRDEAVAAGWFGDGPPEMRARIGDVLAVPYADVAIVALETEPLESRLIGMHGSMVPAEQLVPLLTHLT
ncbi:MAG TPA: nucleotide pyrophosphatase/phosphodiesterase family protein [Streptosporangiaceae bacterium]|nr:nucleotide pyrophosphatase/phosphodiesterase family protein [Streptosporangiaceae bacterium]